MRWYEIEVDGIQRRIPAVRARGRLWFHWNGQTYVIEPTDRGRRGARSTVGSGSLNAPMPGKITRVMVELGDQVAKGQVLVVMEAMKMEYTLQADVTGLVTEVNATVGTNVAQGAVLAKVVQK